MRIIKTLLLASFLLSMFAGSAFAADAAVDEPSKLVLPDMDAPFATDSVYSGHVFSFTTQAIASVACEDGRA
jgi:hypothetical protein